MLINDEIKRVSSVYFNPDSRVQNFLNTHGSTELKKSMSFTDLVRRPELTYDMVRSLDENVPSLSDDVREQVNIQLKYQGYIEREMKQVSDFRKLEAKKIPNEIDYDLVPSLRIEARQKLNNIRPLTVGQASRISGVSPSDISVLLIYLKSGKLNDNR
jgi:tRNA uridine 5-carboxymethylaminomethyl modification enzyme